MTSPAIYPTSELVSQLFPPIDVEGSGWDLFQERFEELLTFCIEVLLISKGEFTINDVDQLINSAPRNNHILSRQLVVCREHISKNPNILYKKPFFSRLEEMQIIQKFLGELSPRIERNEPNEDSESYFEKNKILWEEFASEEDRREKEQLRETLPSECVLNALIAVDRPMSKYQMMSSMTFIPYLATIFCQEPPWQRNGALIIWKALIGHKAPRVQFMKLP